MVDFYIEPNGLFGQSIPWKIHCKQHGGNVLFEKNIPSGSLVLTKGEIEVLSQLYGHNGFDEFPPDKQKKAMETVLRNHRKDFSVEQVPWDKILPTKEYYESIVSIVKTWNSKLDGVNLDYYLNHFLQEQRIFQYLQPAKINVKRFLTHMQQATGAQKEYIHSFMPSAGFARVPEYSHTDTLTGRLKVLSGPNILLLQKEYRDIIESRFGKDGRIVYLDYSSLEPRVLLSVTSPYLIGYLPQDIYSKVMDDLGLTNIPRNLVKLVVLSQIYGAGEETIKSKLLAASVSDPLYIIDKIKEYFGVEQLTEKLFSEFAINDRRHVCNFYGRYIICPSAKRYVLLNYFVQSTAVDVALKGFNRIVQKLEKANLLTSIVPLFILHDGLILDVHNDAYEASIPHLLRFGSENIQGFEGGKFYLKEDQLVPETSVP